MDGRADIKAHGPRDMPVWGEEMWRFIPATDVLSGSVLVRSLKSLVMEAHPLDACGHVQTVLAFD